MCSLFSPAESVNELQWSNKSALKDANFLDLTGFYP